MDLRRLSWRFLFSFSRCSGRLRLFAFRTVARALCASFCSVTVNIGFALTCAGFVLLRAAKGRHSRTASSKPLVLLPWAARGRPSKTANSEPWLLLLLWAAKGRPSSFDGPIVMILCDCA